MVSLKRHQSHCHCDLDCDLYAKNGHSVSQTHLILFFTLIYIYICYVINLQVLRQDEPVLVKAARELCEGEPSEETEQFLRLQNRDLPQDDDDKEITRLYGINFDVDCVNEDFLDDLPGEEMRYIAKDPGN